MLQYVHFRCGPVHRKNSLKDIGISYNIQPSLSKQELAHIEIYEDNWEEKKMNGYLILKMMCYQLLFLTLDMQKVWKNWQDLAWKTV